MSYIDPVANYSLILIIIYFICHWIILLPMFAMAIFGCIICLIVYSVLIMKFQEISIKFEILLKNNNRNIIRYNLMDLIEEHNYFTKITADLNKFIRIILLFVYFFGIPIYLLILYATHHQNLNYLAKLNSSIMIISATGAFFGLTYFNKFIISAAHSPYEMTFTYLSKTNTKNLPLINRLKLMAFMERLSGKNWW